ncbi:MAG TPA: DUF4184 family protein [Opitutaceae bacterium]|nr:DUF4184 family protein [Opitutaceae bacterium]
MPFTISHAAFVLPFQRWVSERQLCALMAGSLAPDFVYFTRDFKVARFAHTLPGAVAISLPIGLVVYWIVSVGFRRFVDRIPDPHTTFLSTWDLYTGKGRSSFFGLVLFVFLGVLSHNIVDSFTHGTGTAVSWFPVLSREVFTLHGISIRVFRLLQYVGSVVGLMILALVYLLAFLRFCRSRQLALWQDGRCWFNWIGLLTATGFVSLIINYGFAFKAWNFHVARAFVFNFLITWMPLGGVALLLYLFFPLRSTPNNVCGRKSIP